MQDILVVEYFQCAIVTCVRYSKGSEYLIHHWQPVLKCGSVKASIPESKPSATEACTLQQDIMPTAAYIVNNERVL